MSLALVMRFRDVIGTSHEISRGLPSTNMQHVCSGTLRSHAHLLFLPAKTTALATATGNEISFATVNMWMEWIDDNDELYDLIFN